MTYQNHTLCQNFFWWSVSHVGLPHRMWHDSKGLGLWDFREEMTVLVTVLGKVLRKTKTPYATVCFLLIFYSIWTFIVSPDSS